MFLEFLINQETHEKSRKIYHENKGRFGHNVAYKYYSFIENFFL